jgi:hypothetical protein
MVLHEELASASQVLPARAMAVDSLIREKKSPHRSMRGFRKKIQATTCFRLSSIIGRRWA